jgi:hypothetical protein
MVKIRVVNKLLKNMVSNTTQQDGEENPEDKFLLPGGPVDNL